MEHRREAGRWLGLVAGLVLALPVAADPVYRWVDRDGRVNYGSAPPPGVVAEALGERGNLSVVPPPPPVPSAPAAEAGRIAELEAALEHERALREQREAEEAAAARLRAACEDRYREPCDEAGRPLAPRYAVVPRAPHRHGPQLRSSWPPDRDPGHRSADKRRGRERLFQPPADARWSSLQVVPRHRDDRGASAPARAAEGWRWSAPGH